eukprot:CAMPEP_0172894840 /NCGR_PEP_ID=MMETSP1075-20121228/151766_1 /TAXON_ID=2916 /ORGANISM="Ceratium fusus, Strain PA161109" /LENGTH=57 /DNA_ID=CAMNT_0013749935 /DNA_START=91 /DNA_END=260 /DNA_ORIENTATION=-
MAAPANAAAPRRVACLLLVASPWTFCSAANRLLGGLAAAVTGEVPVARNAVVTACIA